jgi:hypothetical protein
MKTFRKELSYPGASLDQVWKMLSDPEFREAVCRAQHVVSHDITIAPQGDGMVVRIEQVQATNGVPGFAKKIVGDTTTILSEETWTTNTAADLTVTIPGKPGDMTGGVALTENGDGVVQTIDLAITVGIPLVGGKIEGLLAELMGKAMAKENEVGREWLSR